VANTEDRDADVAAATQSIAQQVEWAIRQRPNQWFCFREMWPKKQADAAAERPLGK
jgi:lauroyl/myristoyl acyltransferase